MIARRKLTLHRNVFPFPILQQNRSRDQIFHDIESVLLGSTLVVAGDEVLVTFGEPFGTLGGTNSMKIVKIGVPQS